MVTQPFHFISNDIIYQKNLSDNKAKIQVGGTVGAVSTGITRASKNLATLQPNISGHGRDRNLGFVLFTRYLTELKICKKYLTIFCTVRFE
jgi:hypothetical protein